jgi:hypothetical protein
VLGEGVKETQATIATPAGKKALVKMRGMVQRIEDQFLAPLDDQARAALHDAVLQIAANQDRRFQQPPA